MHHSTLKVHTFNRKTNGSEIRGYIDAQYLSLGDTLMQLTVQSPI